MGLETHISLWVSRLSSEFLLTSYAELDAALSTCFLNVLSASRQVVTLSRLNQLVCFSGSWIDLTHVKLQFHLSGSLNVTFRWINGVQAAGMHLCQGITVVPMNGCLMLTSVPLNIFTLNTTVFQSTWHKFPILKFCSCQRVVKRYQLPVIEWYLSIIILYVIKIQFSKLVTRKIC